MSRSSLPEPHPNGHPRWVLILASLSSFMVALDAMVVTTALGTMRDSLHASMQALQWTVNAYNLSFAVFLMTGAALGDRFGRRRMLLAGLALFTASSAACALASDVAWLIAARALQGMGAALVMPLAMALLTAAFAKEARGKALGLFSSITGLALIIGPAVGGVVAQGLAWQWIFWINLPVGLAVMPLVRSRIPESRGPNAALDLPGLACATLAALGLVWALTRGHAAGWSSLEVEMSLAAGVLFAVGFMGWERAAPAPMVPLRLFRSRAFSSGIAAAFLFYAPMTGTLFFLPQFLQAQGHGPLDAGLRIVPWTATLFVTAPIAGRLVNRLGERMLVTTGVLLQAVGFAWIAAIAAPDLAYARLAPALVVAGAGVSMAMPAVQNAVLGAVAPLEIGKASGTFNMVRYLGNVFGVALLVEVFSHGGDLGSAQAFSGGFAHAMWVAAALSLLSAAVGLRLPGRGAAMPAAAAAKA